MTVFVEDWMPRAQQLEVEQAVVVADAALAPGLVDRAELDGAVQRATLAEHSAVSVRRYDRGIYWGCDE